MKSKTTAGNDGPFKQYPGKADQKYVKNAGMFMAFNKTKYPSFYSLYFFTQQNRCDKMVSGACNDSFKTSIKKIAGAVTSDSIEESGFMDFN